MASGIQIDLGGNQTVTIGEGDEAAGSSFAISALGSSELTVDGVDTRVDGIASVTAGSSATFNAINGGNLLIDQGIGKLGVLNSMKFGVGDNSGITFDAGALSVGNMLSSYEVEFSGDGTGSFTFEKPTVSLLDNYTFNVKGMQEGDQLNLGGGDWSLDEGFLGWQDAYRDGQLNLVQGNDLIGGKVVARVDMTEEQYQEFLKDPDAYLSGGKFTYPVCFAAGTMISTPDGEAAVETLSIGDLVMTASGKQVPVKWIGRQTIRRLAAAGNYSPVRIREGALAAGIPNQDLVLTASHGVILDDLVINAGALINHDTIDYVPGSELPDAVTYYHIETDNHEVILANGTEAETYVDYVDRQAFDNYAEYVALYGIETRVVEMPRHRISSRRLLPLALRERLGIEDVMSVAKTA
ncbi:Hint domain-containing protein [Halomonas eurihalina]|uniref:Hint domain-containing protein n=1 Tax=Halomonas eurihalina TaxID=42566 RepID=A0A5D9CR45_HALER|nr:Hint domain-containing protein [Halomonas eurihalina]MDR5860510.1 Hint domain-containing protein [Halomonas eurihalina]TZG32781.1 Hint domain-containing protein [Halomonas eurihalina]